MSNQHLHQQTHAMKKKLTTAMMKLQSKSSQALGVELECLTRWSTSGIKLRDACTVLQMRLDSSSNAGDW